MRVRRWCKGFQACKKSSCAGCSEDVDLSETKPCNHHGICAFKGIGCTAGSMETCSKAKQLGGVKMQITVSLRDGSQREVTAKCAGCQALLTPEGEHLEKAELSPVHNTNFNHDSVLRVVPWTVCQVCHPSKNLHPVGV